MSKKGQLTTTDYLEFDRTLNKSIKIIKTEKQYKIGFLILLGINTGLRISDILALKHKDFKNEYLDLTETKTGKHRKININAHVRDAYKILLNRVSAPINENDFVFTSQKNSVFAVSSVNRELKKILKDSKSKLNISSHSLRKTFGRRVFQNNHETDKSLIYLSDMFNHTSIATTRRYLGIRQDELSDIYMNL